MLMMNSTFAAQLSITFRHYLVSLRWLRALVIPTLERKSVYNLRNFHNATCVTRDDKNCDNFWRGFCTFPVFRAFRLPSLFIIRIFHQIERIRQCFNNSPNISLNYAQAVLCAGAQFVSNTRAICFIWTEWNYREFNDDDFRIKRSDFISISNRFHGYAMQLKHDSTRKSGEFVNKNTTMTLVQDHFQKMIQSLWVRTQFDKIKRKSHLAHAKCSHHFNSGRAVAASTIGSTDRMILRRFMVVTMGANDRNRISNHVDVFTQLTDLFFSASINIDVVRLRVYFMQIRRWYSYTGLLC